VRGRHGLFSFEGLCFCSDVTLVLALRYASDAPVIRYAKIAMKLPDKTVRDVALRCRWMNVSNKCSICAFNSVIMVPGLVTLFPSNDLRLCI
jgi:hypothetical protein